MQVKGSEKAIIKRTFSYAWKMQILGLVAPQRYLDLDWPVYHSTLVKCLLNQASLSFYLLSVSLLVVIIKLLSVVTVIILDPCLELCHAGNLSCNLSWAWKVSRWLFFSVALVK